MLAIDDAMVAAIDAWCAEREDCANRSDAIRKLVELGLAAQGKR